MTRKTILTALSAILFMFASGIASAGTIHRSRTIFDHTSVTGGLLIRFNPALTLLPDNCAAASLLRRLGRCQEGQHTSAGVSGPLDYMKSKDGWRVYGEAGYF